MSDQTDETSITPNSNYSTQLQSFEDNLLTFIAQHRLPTDTILVSIQERSNVFKNIESVVSKIDDEQKQRSVYISKFIAASAAGLFDAALNYLWDETIYELRRRVAHYDIAYFYDITVTNTEKRKRLSTEEDLVKIDDSELIKGSHDIGLISDLGFKHLDYIRYMRNWASAAHPNQNQITGLQLIGMLETCVIEVIKLPLSNVVVEIQRLLANIKSNRISESDARQIAAFFVGLTQERVNALASGFFGIYTQIDTTSQTRENIHLLAPHLWNRVDEQTRQQFGIKYARFVASNDQTHQRLARQFLEVVSGLSYIPDNIRVADIETAIENLLTAHRNTNNFYNEPAFARQLQRLIGETGNVPPQVNNIYVLGLVEVFLTNGNGTAWNAEPVYQAMLEQFDTTQALIAVLSFTNLTISSRLQFILCQTKYKELLEMMNNKISMPAVKELIDDIDKYAGPLARMKDDSRIRRKVDSLMTMIET